MWSQEIECLFYFQGIPTHDANGKELTKSALKKLIKQYEAQEKKYKASQGAAGAAGEGGAVGGATTEQ